MAQGTTTGLGWTHQKLAQPAAGDFDLSFDLTWKGSGMCELRVGLGSRTRASYDAGDEDDPNIADGVFASIRAADYSKDKKCKGFFPGPVARSGAKQWMARGGDCFPRPVRGGAAHYVLRRRGSTVSLDWASEDGCYVGSESVSTGSVGPLTELAMGVDSLWSTGEFAYVGDCGDQELTVDNLVMRRVGCENTCDEDGLGGDDVCAVRMDGPDRCGTCWNMCNSGEVCRAGQCVCDPPAVACPATSACDPASSYCPPGCVDIARDSDNCGQCGRVCQACMLGTCPTDPPGCLNPFPISGPLDDVVLTVPDPWTMTRDGVILEWTPDRSGTVLFSVWPEPPYVVPGADSFFVDGTASTCGFTPIPDDQAQRCYDEGICPVQAGVPMLIAIVGNDTRGRQVRVHLNATYQTSP
jgi:hypothetical protein